MVALVQTLSSTAAEEQEWRLRCDMAAVFRIAARVGRTPKGCVLHPRYLTAWPTTSTLVMGGHGVTVIEPTMHDAFDELFIAERTAMYQMTAVSSGQKLRTLPDARLHLDAWRRVLDREEPDYAT